MLSVKKNVIELTRGDTAYFTINVKTPQGQPYTIEEGDKLFFALKKNVKDNEYAIAPKELIGNVLELLPEETEFLSFGKYFYDIKMVKKDGVITTIIDASEFIIKETVIKNEDL